MVYVLAMSGCSGQIKFSELKLSAVSNITSVSENTVRGNAGELLQVGLSSALEEFSVDVDKNSLHDSITAYVENGVLNITGTNSGNYNVLLVASAKDKWQTRIAIVVELMEKPMDVEVIYPQPMANVIESTATDNYSMLVGTSDVAFEFRSPATENFNYALDGTGFAIKPNGALVLISAVDKGEATLKISSSVDGYSQYNKEIKLKSFLPRLTGGFTYSPDKAEILEVGKKISINPNFGEDGVVVTADVMGMDIFREGSGVALSTNTPGDYSVTVKATREGYEEYSESFVIRVTPERVPLTVSHKQVRIVAGESTNVTINSDVKSKINITYSGDIKAALSNSTIKITGSRVGSGKVTLTASADGYYDKVIDIPVEVVSPPLKLSFTESVVGVELGRQSGVGIVGYENGDEVSLSIVGDATASHRDGSIFFTLNSGNSATILVTVKRQGYTPWSNQIKLAMQTASVGSSVDEVYQQVLNEVNAQRAAAGLSVLTYRSDIEAYAAIRAQEIVEKWDHTRPDGRAFYTVFTDSGKRYIKVGENLAKGSAGNLGTANQVVNAWMGSPGHRANILNPDFKGMAVSLYVNNGIYYWAQLFIVD